jgi:hypothetical protein
MQPRVSAIELELAQYFMEVAESERKMDVYRQLLAEQPSFEPYSAFMRLDPTRSAEISCYDLLEFLKYILCASLSLDTTTSRPPKASATISSASTGPKNLANSHTQSKRRSKQS